MSSGGSNGDGEGDAGLDETLASDPALDATATSGANPALDATAASNPALDATAASGASPGSYRKGETFARFMVVDQLGAGGMGVVLAAYDPDLDRKVAIKVLHPGAGGAEARERLKREAQAMAKLAHPNVVTVFEVGVERGSVFIAMELVEGGTLTTWLRDATRSRAEILERFRDAGRGLAAAHAAKLVHRDFKPDNVLVGKDGRVRVSDFGLVGEAGARRTQPPDRPVTALTTSLTATGSVMGTPIYMAPEQHAGAPTDARTDQFSFCVALYEALYGERPFAGTTYEEIFEAVMEGELLPAPANATVPAWLREVVVRGLAVKPADRFASMTELLDALARDPTAARRRKQMVALAAGAIVLGGGGIGYAMWSRAQPTIERCADVAYRWEQPICIGTTEGRPRPVVWQLTSKAGRVLKQERVNGGGELVDEGGEPAVREYEYGDDGHVRGVLLRDRFGELQRRVAYTSGHARMELRDRDGNPKPLEGARHTVYLQDLDARGFVTRQRFANVFGTPRIDDELAVFGVRYELADTGAWTAREYLDADGKPIANKRGVARETRRFDALGDVVETRGLGLDGKPIGDANGIAAVRTTFEASGNRTHAFFDVADKPIEKEGCAQVRETVDARGAIARSTCLDAKGAAVIDTQGKASFAYTRDARGDLVEIAAFDPMDKPVLVDGVFKRQRILDGRRVVEERYLGADDQPAALAEGYARRTFRFDRGKLVEEDHFAVDGKPTTDKHGVWRSRHAYDARGNRVETTVYDATSALVLDVDGCARRTFAFDERNRRTDTRCFGVDLKLARDRTGVARTHEDYNDQGDVTRVSFFDPSDAPTAGTERAVAVQFKFDDRGNEIERSWHGENDVLVLNREKFAVERRRFDARGKLTEIAFFGTERKPIRRSDGTSIIRRTWNDQGKEASVTFLGADGKPILRSDIGIASEETRYDQRGRPTEVVERDVDGAVIINRLGWARSTMRYDDRNLQIERRYFGADNKPITTTDGYATLHMTYDARRRDVAISLTDATGKPATHRQGWSTLRRARDDQGKVVRETQVDITGNIILTETSVFDALGNVVRRRWLDGADQPTIARVEEAAGFDARFDHRGRRVEQVFLGVDGKPRHSRRAGFARTTMRYDNRGNRIEHAFFGENGAPFATVGAVARRTYVYDAFDRELEVSAFGIDARRVLDEDGFARRTNTYNERGDRIESRTFGVDGRPILAKSSGIARTTRRFDGNGNLLEEGFFGIDDKPKAWDNGVARATYAYNSRGEKIEARLFDVHGKPGPQVPVVQYAYNDAGQMIREAYVDLDGKPFEFAGVATMHQTYEHGRLVETSFRGSAGDPRPRTDGVAYLRNSYNARGNLVVETFLDVREQLTPNLGGWATMWTTYDGERPTISTRFVGTDPKGDGVVGMQMGPDDQLFRWRRVGGQYRLATGIAYTPGAPLDPTREQRARAAEAGIRTERLRTSAPELFRGARGLLIVEIDATRAGYTAGLRAGDVMIELEGRKLDRYADFAPVEMQTPGTLVVIRDRRHVTLTIQPGRQGMTMEHQ